MCFLPSRLVLNLSCQIAEKFTICVSMSTYTRSCSIHFSVKNFKVLNFKNCVAILINMFPYISFNCNCHCSFFKRGFCTFNINRKFADFLFSDWKMAAGWFWILSSGLLWESAYASHRLVPLRIIVVAHYVDAGNRSRFIATHLTDLIDKFTAVWWILWNSVD